MHKIYYAQIDYRREHKTWAKTLTELGFSESDYKRLAGPPKIETTESLFEVTVEAMPSGGKPRQFHIRQDSLVWEN